jgi:hypothetical protein
MSMYHKAFIFDSGSFETSLSSILREALGSNDSALLLRFIENNWPSLTDPNTGEPLTSDWRLIVDTGDVQRCGDIALTLYYDPNENIGLGYDWSELDDLLLRLLPGRGGAVVLGKCFGASNQPFDPGRQGSYFQSPEFVRENLLLINRLMCLKTEDADALSKVKDMLQAASTRNKGLYITF